MPPAVRADELYPQFRKRGLPRVGLIGTGNAMVRNMPTLRVGVVQACSLGRKQNLHDGPQSRSVAVQRGFVDER